MLEYYIKAQEGFEWCKKNLEGDISLDQFESCHRLCQNYTNLCNHYYYIVNKKNKRNGEYFGGVLQNYCNILGDMLTQWKSQYNEMEQKYIDEEQKQKEFVNTLALRDEYEEQKEKSDRVIIKGFSSYSKPKKKKRKKNNG